MPLSSGRFLKTALRCLFILILAIIGVGLFYSKEIGQLYRDWKTGGSSQESIALPQPQIRPGDNNRMTASPGSPGAISPATPGASPSAAPSYGLPDPSAIFEQPGPQDNARNSQGNSQPGGAEDSNRQNGQPAPPTQAGQFEQAAPLGNIPAASAPENRNPRHQAAAVNSGGFDSNPQAAAVNSGAPDFNTQVAVPQSSEPVGGTEIITPSGQRVQVGGVAPLQHQDSVITQRYIYELAAFLVNSYYPPGTHKNGGQNGYISASLLNLNVHYGADTQRLLGRSRSVILHYVLSPSMLRALYRLYENDFLTAMQQISEKQERKFSDGTRRMTAAEQKRMFADYAVYAKGLASLFEACAASPAIRDKLDAYYTAALEVVASNQDYIAASIAYDQARPGEDDAREALNQARIKYDRNVKSREDAREALLLSLKRYPGVRMLSDSNMLYGAGWIKRRLADDSADTDALAAVSQIMLNLSEEMGRLGRGG